MSLEDETFLAIVAVCLKKKEIEKRKLKKRRWVTECQKRNEFTYQNLLEELRVSPKKDFRHMLTNDSVVYEELLRMIGPLIKKQDTLMRDAIPVGLRLSTTLRFLATGKNFEDMRSSSRMSPNTISKIVLETCEAIVSRLEGYIKLPKSQQEWKTIENNFYEKCNFPNCMGAATGKHIAIIKPTGSKTLYYNYKKFFSIVLMGIVNSNYEFIFADVEISGSVLGSENFYHSLFGNMIYKSSPSIENDSQLFRSREIGLPHVFVVDGGFQLSDQFLKPFNDVGLTEQQQIYNNRLGQTLQIVENTFGALSSQFGVLQKSICLAPDKVKTIALACCYLYNFLRKKTDHGTWDGVFDKVDSSGVLKKGSWREVSELTPLEPLVSKSFCDKSEKIRQDFVEYFNKGEVS